MKEKILTYFLSLVALLAVLFFVFRLGPLLYLLAAMEEGRPPSSVAEWKQIILWIINPTH